MRDQWFVHGLTVLGLLLGLGSEQSAASDLDPCDVTGYLASDRPGDADTPTEVTMGVRMIDLTDIDDVDQTLTIAYLVRQRWFDPRLASLDGCEVPLTTVWSPEITVVNSGHLFSKLPATVRIGTGGGVTYLQDYYGTLSSYETFEDFPFDEHVFNVWLLSADYGEREVNLIVDEEFTGRRDLLNISDWKIGRVTARIKSELVDATGKNHATFELSIPARRIELFYVWKVILPLCLIVAMSWVVFWINPANYGPQIGLSATSMLTLIAFLFTTTNIVPRLSYFTRFDLFLGFSLILVFLALIETLVSTYLVAQGAPQLARRIDHLSRILFPAAFLLIIMGVHIL